MCWYFQVTWLIIGFLTQIVPWNVFLCKNKPTLSCPNVPLSTLHLEFYQARLVSPVDALGINSEQRSFKVFQWMSKLSFQFSPDIGIPLGMGFLILESPCGSCFYWEPGLSFICIKLPFAQNDGGNNTVHSNKYLLSGNPFIGLEGKFAFFSVVKISGTNYSSAGGRFTCIPNYVFPK